MTISTTIFDTNPLQPKHNVSLMRGFVLILVTSLHLAAAIWFLQPTPPVKKSPKIIEIAMLSKPKPEPVKIEPVKEPPLPVVKKEPIKPVEKPKPVAKPPEPVKKITPQKPKPMAQPKVLTTSTETAEVSIPKFESAPTFTPAVPVQTVAKTVQKPVETSTQSESNESSNQGTTGGTCENCSSIEKRLQRRYARRNFSGSISFLFTIGEDGTVQKASIKKAEPADMFDDDTLAEIKESLMEMEFEPKMVNGKATRFDGSKTIKFQPAN